MPAFIFDVDGTLVDSVDFHAAAWQSAFKMYGFDIPYKAVRQQIGKGGDELLPEFLSKEEIEEFGEDLKKYRSSLFKRDYLNRVKPFPDVRELFVALKQKGFKIAIGSSAPKDDLKHYLELLNVADLVDAKTSADDVEKSKPHPDIFDLVLEQLQISPDQAVVVGDSPHDAEAAQKAGIKSIGLLCGGFPNDSLRTAGMGSLYADPSELLKHLESALTDQAVAIG
jgi:HAD superfamily hydrolase (TIGR01509 family)